MKRPVGTAEPHGIDAMPELRGLRQHHVGGGIAKRAAELLAADDRLRQPKSDSRAGRRPRRRRLRQAARGCGSTRRFRRPRRERRRPAYTPKPCRSPDAIRNAGPPCRSLPKWKSKPVTAWLMPRLRSSMSVTNCSALWLGEVAGERLFDDGVETELGDEPRLHRRRRDQEQRHVRAEDGARMRLEGEHQRRHVRGARLHRGRDRAPPDGRDARRRNCRSPPRRRAIRTAAPSRRTSVETIASSRPNLSQPRR